jgi:hypothetical protein
VAPAAHLGVDLEHGLVAHVEGAHQLEGGDLQREVEWSDQRHLPPAATASGGRGGGPARSGCPHDLRTSTRHSHRRPAPTSSSHGETAESKVQPQGGAKQGGWALGVKGAAYRSEGPAEAAALLAGVVPRVGKGARQEAHLVPREVLKELARHHHLTQRLRQALGGHALDEARKEVGHSVVAQQGRHARRHRAIRHVPAAGRPRGGQSSRGTAAQQTVIHRGRRELVPFVIKKEMEFSSFRLDSAMQIFMNTPKRGEARSPCSKHQMSAQSAQGKPGGPPGG